MNRICDEMQPDSTSLQNLAILPSKGPVGTSRYRLPSVSLLMEDEPLPEASANVHDGSECSDVCIPPAVAAEAGAFLNFESGPVVYGGKRAHSHPLPTLVAH